MFTAVFSRILDSSLRQEEAETRWLFLTMLIIGDEAGDGTVDMPVEALAARAALSEDSTRRGLEALLAPDPESNSRKEEGRRLVHLRDGEIGIGRGWIIVNWPRYRALANAESRRKQLATASAAYRKRLKEIDRLGLGRKRHHSSSSVIGASSSVIPSPAPAPAPPYTEIPTQGSSVKQHSEDIKIPPAGVPPIPVVAGPKRFTHPTIRDVQAYVAEKNLQVDPVRFVAYYESIGWRVGKNPMKNWKAAVWTWARSPST